MSLDADDAPYPSVGMTLAWQNSFQYGALHGNAMMASSFIIEKRVGLCQEKTFEMMAVILIIFYFP